MWRLKRFISTLSLFLFAQSLWTSSAAVVHGREVGKGVVSVTFKRVALRQQLQSKVTVADEQQYNYLPTHKLGIHLRKGRSGGGGGFATRARGKTSSSSAAAATHFSASILACSFFFPLFLM